MFHDISKALRDRMEYLERVDARDRKDGTPRSRRLRQIPRETGRFIALLAAGAPEGTWLEIGTGAGYSSLWLALACLVTSRTLTTFEPSAEKAALARETFRLAGVESVVQCVESDARNHLMHYARISFCFLDTEKELYRSCYDALIPRMVRGGLLVADNAISHGEVLLPFIEAALQDPRVDAMVVPVGSGELVCRKA